MKQPTTKTAPASEIPPLASVQSDLEILAAFPDGRINAPDVEPEIEPDPQDYDPRAWRLVDEHTPSDGTLIETKADPDMPDDAAVVLVWRRTRRRDAANRCWVQVGFWANALTREEVTVEPFVWRMVGGFLLPGMVS